jgi:hypothetical protein
MTYTITVRALVPFEDRDPDDQQDDPTGEHLIEADSREEALDLFHGTVPIAVLDHFEITCEEA